MRTTLSINDALLAEVRRRARRADRPFRDVLEEAITRGLASAGKSTAAGGKVRITPRALGLKAIYRQMSLNQLYDQLEAERTGTKGVSPR